MTSALCLECKAVYAKKSPAHIYCCNECRSAGYAKDVQGHYFTDLSTGNTGALGELLVTCDLIRKGYHVFRAVSHSCICDLCVIKDGKIHLLEVRTSHRDKQGNISYNKKTRLKPEEVIFAAVVHRDKGAEYDIYYFPELP